MGKNFYISDLHFGHKNVIRFDSRPFSGTEEMEQEIIKRWNDVVSNEDTVYHLGDFCWSKDIAEWCRLLDALNGNKVLIQGNHDLHSYPSAIKNRVNDIKPYKEITDGDKSVILCHYPINLYKHSNNPDVIMLCGHVHVTTEDIYLSKWRTQMWTDSDCCNLGNIINVGCMKNYMNYTPRTITYLANTLDDMKRIEILRLACNEVNKRNKLDG
jgi:calcineurin-like phosphoesterase family protein